MSTLPSTPPFSLPRLRIPALSSPLSSPSHSFFPSAASGEVSQSSDPTPVLPLFLFGLLAAFGTVCLVCKVPAAFMHTWTAFFLRSIAYVVGVIAAGVAGMQILWLLLSEKPTLNFGSLSLSLACSWAFLPSIVFFYREHSPWTLAAMPLATAITALSLRRLFLSDTSLSGVEPEFIPPPAPTTAAVPYFSGISTPNRNLWWIVALAAAAQAAFLLWLLNHTSMACLLLSIPAFVLTWQSSAAARKPRHATPYLRLLLALLFTALALLPWLDTPLAIQLSHILRSDRVLTPTLSSLRSAPAVDYTSIVLWPSTPKKKTVVTQPIHNSLAPGSTEVTKPLVIPFDGPYWYFQHPDTKPSHHAFVMHGKSTAVNMHSTNDLPLQMAAHQTLDKPISLNCCREIDLDITNADNRPGLLAISLILTDTTSPLHPSQQLALQPIVSSESAHFSLLRAPIPETLRFRIPPSQLRRFNDITVAFHTARERSLGGAKVSIKQFTLLPR